MGGQELTAVETATIRQVMAGMGGGRGGRPGGQRSASNDYQLRGSYIVFVLRNGRPTPVNIKTGLTDLDYSEVRKGPALGDSVIMLPSASLIQSQADFASGSATSPAVACRVKSTTTTPAAGGSR